MLIHKARAYAEIYNDLDGELVNVFRVLQNPRRAQRLESLLKITPFARDEFELSYKPSRSPVERARRTIIRSFMGFGSDSVARLKASRVGFNTRISSVMRTGFRWNSNRSGTTAATDWARYPNYIRMFCERLQGVTIENRDAITILRKMDREDALHYVDPPYPMSVRSRNPTKKVEHRYRHEMTERQHTHLAKVLHSLKGMVIVSSYRGELYDGLYSAWMRREWTGGQFCSANSHSQIRTECVWLNEAATRAVSQEKLFF